MTAKVALQLFKIGGRRPPGAELRERRGKARAYSALRRADAAPMVASVRGHTCRDRRLPPEFTEPGTEIGYAT
jgi:hypothetical protein